MSYFDEPDSRKLKTPRIAIALWIVGWIALILCGFTAIFATAAVLSREGPPEAVWYLCVGFAGVVSALVLMALAAIVQKLNQIAVSVAASVAVSPDGITPPLPRT